MIDPDKRKAIYLLHEQGMGLREIGRRLLVSVNTVSAIIVQKGIPPMVSRSDKISIDPELVFQLFNECDGRLQRMHEKLTEEQSVKIGYSTLSRKVRELGIVRLKNERCEKIPDETGVETQQDTSE